MRNLRTPFVLLLPLLVAGLPSPASARQETPPASEIIDRYVQAIGGEAAVRAETSWKATGTFSMPAAGLSGTIEAYNANGKSFGRVTLPAVGEILRGYDGQVGWSLNPLEGPRLLEGKELGQAREEAQRGATLRDSTVIAAMQTVGRDEMNGQACWKVKLTWKSGRETHDCYSVESGLLIASTGTATTPMGEFEYTTLMNDYKTFGDLRIATRVVQESLGQQQIVTTDSITFGEIEPGVFELPPEIRALLK